jgi:hypothetical protein
MTTTVSIAELLKAGVALEAIEAVAITQQLIQSLKTSPAADIEPPFGPPTAETVVLDADGSVSCAGCGVTPAISEIAIFLDSLLPHGSPRVPGGVRYAIARALLEVDVAPFDSLDAFSDALARHERGDRADIIRRLVRRSESPCAVAVFVQADRRRPRANATELRRALREADARLYAHHASTAPHEATRRAVELRQPPMRGASAVAACLGAGLMLVAAGDAMQRGEMPRVAAAPIVTAAPLPVAARPAVDAREQPTSLVGTIPSPPTELAEVSDSALPAPRVQGATKNRSAASTTSRAPRTAATIKKTGTQRPGVLDRMKLKWLRKAFVLHADEL